MATAATGCGTPIKWRFTKTRTTWDGTWLLMPGWGDTFTSSSSDGSKRGPSGLKRKGGDSNADTSHQQFLINHSSSAADLRAAPNGTGREARCPRYPARSLHLCRRYAYRGSERSPHCSPCGGTQSRLVQLRV